MALDQLVRGFDVARVHNDALRLLARVGLEVRDEALRGRLVATGAVRQSGHRVLLDAATVEAYAEQLRHDGAARAPAEPDERLTVSVARWPMFFVEPQSDELRPFTTDVLIEYTKLVDAFREEGLTGSVPGTPQDVPPPIQELVQYAIACRYSRGAGFPGAIGEPRAVDYMLGIARVMGHRIGVGVEAYSPLTFSGNSVALVLRLRSQAEGVGLDPMPIMGVSAPLDWHAAWAQSVAENLGGYAILRLLGFERVSPTFRLFPASMRSATIAFGSPEFLLALLTRSRIRELYGQPIGAAESLHTMAKLPDAHAVAERSAQTLFAAMLGHRRFSAAGSLAIDEVFSPEQLVIDLEIRDYVERLMRGIEAGGDDCLSVVAEGLDGRSFLTAERTLANWREFFWLPRVFLQTSRAQWQASPRSVLADAWALARERLARHEYELDDERRRAVDSIVQEAEQALT